MAQLIADRRKVLLLEEEKKREEASFLRMRAQHEAMRAEQDKENRTG